MLFSLQCQLSLVIVMVEDDGLVLPGPGRIGGVVAAPEHGQELAVGDTSRVVVNLDCLGVVTEVLISWVPGGAAGVSHAGADYAIETPEPGVRTPESAKGKGGCLYPGRSVPLNCLCHRTSTLNSIFNRLFEV